MAVQLLRVTTSAPEDHLADDIAADIAAGEDPRHPLRRFLSRCRAWVERHPRIRWVYRFAVGVLGTVIAVVGLILVPLPGPGWLIVFLGVGILGTEFPAAKRINVFLKRTLARFWAWWKARTSKNVTRE